jgi:AAA15 family ATPase/GTPase
MGGSAHSLLPFCARFVQICGFKVFFKAFLVLEIEVTLLIRFRVGNFRSFQESQELSLVASTGKEHPESVIQIPGFQEGLLRVAAVYGPNASGKSNLFRALQFFLGAIEHSQRSWKPDGGVFSSPFLLNPDSSKVSEYQMDFLLESTRFQYGFSHDSSQILREWLYSYPSGKRQMWFERDATASGEIKFGKHFPGENRAIEGMTRKNSLFLSAAAQSNHESILPLFTWLTSKIHFLFGSRTSISPDLGQELAKSNLHSRISQLLSQADLGIVGMTVETENVDEKFAEIIDDMIRRINELSSSSAEFHSPREVHRVKLQHRGKNDFQIAFQNQDESAGTLALLSLLVPALDAIDSGGVLCVDELDSSLHPLLALEIVKLFISGFKTEECRAQLIFNTHDVNLLDSSILRRDQVWFTEKDNEGGTHLYSLSDFRPRKKENLKRGYLQGRYGAVPYLGSIQFTKPGE